MKAKLKRVQKEPSKRIKFDLQLHVPEKDKFMAVIGGISFLGVCAISSFSCAYRSSTASSLDAMVGAYTWMTVVVIGFVFSRIEMSRFEIGLHCSTVFILFVWTKKAVPFSCFLSYRL